MPINLDEFASKKEITPKYFDKELFTGNGVYKSGLLNPLLTPTNPNRVFEGENYLMNKNKKISSNGVLIKDFILDPILFKQYVNIKNLSFEKLSNLENLVKIGKDVYMSFSILNTTFKKTQDKYKNTNKKELQSIYKLGFYRKNDKSDDNIEMIKLDNINGQYKNHFYDGRQTVYYKPFNDGIRHIEDIYKKDNQGIFFFTNNVMVFFNELENKYQTNIDYDVVNDYLKTVTEYDLINKASQRWNDKAIDHLSLYLTQSITNTNSGYSYNEEIDATKEFILMLDSTKLNLETYQDIYEILEKKLPNQVEDLAKLNQNLLLSNTLITIDKNKHLLPKIKDISNTFPKGNYSQSQLKAITSTSPLIMVTAGAGCGKTTAIKGRIEYLIQSGIVPDDITALSFSNAAADNVKEKYENIRSMTIAKMISIIYSANFSHQIATIETFINAVKIKKNFKNVRFETIDMFISYLYKILSNKDNGFMKMNSLIEKRYDEIIKILDTLNLTTLELEIMIAYQKIDKLKVPNEVKTKHIIIDEVQDNSIFEFVYALKYVEVFKSTLFLMGDPSQTLFEFRASNPKAINTLEKSGVFDTFTLEINYRSKQDILDFANSILKDIEANKYANVSLKANNITTTDVNTFKEKVKAVHKQLPKITNFADNIEPFTKKILKPYIDEKLENDEQVALLAFTRYDVIKFQKVLEELYKDKEFVNLCPKRSKDSTIISAYIKSYKSNLKFLDKKEYAKAIFNSIIKEIPNLIKSSNKKYKQKKQQNAARFVSAWYNKNTSSIQRYANQYLNKEITIDELEEKASANLLNYEVKNNVIRQSLIAKENNEQKAKDYNDADIVLSTIHSAKGLEFENAIVIYKDPSGDLKQEDKRMYYVALTRAINSEFILSYGTKKESIITENYKKIIKQLTAQNKTSNKN